MRSKIILTSTLVYITDKKTYNNSRLNRTFIGMKCCNIRKEVFEKVGSILLIKRQ
jgi:hypothetical protein